MAMYRLPGSGQRRGTDMWFDNRLVFGRVQSINNHSSISDAAGAGDAHGTEPAVCRHERRTVTALLARRR